METQPWDIDWTAGLPECREFEDHELPLNKDKRYAMSVPPSALLDSSGRAIPLRAQTEDISSTQAPSQTQPS